MDLQTTLNFFGRTEEAIEFYCKTLDAENLFMMRFRESPDKSMMQPRMADKIFHATFETFFASRYGIVVDRFGLSWKIITES